MNKTILKLAAVSTLAAAIMACNGGSSGGSSGPAQVSASVAPQLPAGDGQAGVGTYESNTSGGYIINLQSGTPTYTSVTLNIPSQPTNIQLSGSKLVVTTGSPTSPTVYVASSGVSSSNASGVSSRNVSPEATSTNQVSFSNIANTIVSPVNFIPAYNNFVYTGAQASGNVLFAGIESSGPGSDASAITSYASGCSSGATSVTALASTVSTLSQYNAAYIGTGDNAGNICIQNLSTNAWLNVTGSAATKYVPSSHGQVNGIAFFANSSSNYGYWYNVDGTVWEIVAPIGATSCTSSTCSINQLNGSAYAGGPSASIGTIQSILVDTNNNLFVATTGGLVYSLQNGFNSWTKVQLTLASGPADTGTPVLSFATNGSVIATTPNAQYNLGL